MSETEKQATSAQAAPSECAAETLAGAHSPGDAAHGVDFDRAVHCRRRRRDHWDTSADARAGRVAQSKQTTWPCPTLPS